MAYLERYIALPSRVLRWGAAAGDARCAERGGSSCRRRGCYVLADLFDKGRGPPARRAARRPQAAPPAPRFLLAGNRDINKPVLRAELGRGHRRDPAE